MQQGIWREGRCGVLRREDISLGSVWARAMKPYILLYPPRRKYEHNKSVSNFPTKNPKSQFPDQILVQCCSVLSQHLGRSSSHLSPFAPFGVSTFRSLSTSPVPGFDESGAHVAGTLSDSVLQDVSSQTTTVSGVVSDGAIDSVVHFDAAQQIIDNVHSFTGLNWWASIVVTTVLIRGGRVFRTMLRKHSGPLFEIRNQGGDPLAPSMHHEELQNLVTAYGGYRRVKFYLSFHIPLVMTLLQHHALICIGKTINNMTGKVATFKTGGALWFTDLTTQDTSFIFPLLTGLAFWITVECDAMVGLEGSFIHRKQGRYLVIPMILVGMLFSKAVHCYMMSCMLFSIAFMHVICRPGVMKQLGIPEVPEYLPIMWLKKKSAIVRDPKEKVSKS